MNSSSTL